MGRSAGGAGVIAMETNVSTVTCSVASLLLMPCAWQLMVASPWVKLLARPAALTVATAGVPDDHDTEFVKSELVPSVKMPWQWYCCCVPLAIVWSTGDRSSVLRIAAVTCSVALPVWPWYFAVTATVPTLEVLVAPPDEPLLIVAML